MIQIKTINKFFKRNLRFFCFNLSYGVLVIHFFSYAESYAQSKETSIPSVPQKSVTYADVAIGSGFSKLLEVPGIRNIYNDCKEDNPALSSNIPNCIWNHKNITADQKKQVTEIYKAELKTNTNSKDEKVTNQENFNSRSPANTKDDESKTELTARKMNVGIDYATDPAVIALMDFYGKKLHQILDPEKALSKKDLDDGKILSVDHRKFTELYKSALGKSIISSLTSYCLDTNPPTTNDNNFDFLISRTESTRKDNQRINVESLSANKIELGLESAMGTRWSNCISSVPENCTKFNGSEDPDKVYTSRRACLVTDYIKSAKKNLIINDKTGLFYDDLAKVGATGIALNTIAITDKNKMSNESLLEITSTDVEESLKKTTDMSKLELEDCLKSNEEAKCKKYLSTNKEANEIAFVEFGLRKEIETTELKNQLDSSPDKINKYLKEEGFSDEQIKEMLKDQTKVTELKDKINTRFSNEKKAIIEEMANRINGKTADINGSIDTGNVKDRNKLDKIKIEIESRPKDLANLVKFNNIVSSYLTIGDPSIKDETEKNNKAKRNTASLLAETNKLSDSEKKEMQKKIKELNIKDEKDDSVDLDVKEINALLKYK